MLSCPELEVQVVSVEWEETQLHFTTSQVTLCPLACSRIPQARSSRNLSLNAIRYNILTGESKFLRKSGIKLDSDSFETKQVFYKSKVLSLLL